MTSVKKGSSPLSDLTLRRLIKHASTSYQVITLILPLSIPILLSNRNLCLYIDRNIEDYELLSRSICPESTDLVEFFLRPTGIWEYQVCKTKDHNLSLENV